MTEAEIRDLKRKLILTLQTQGFIAQDGQKLALPEYGKEEFRNIQLNAKAHSIGKHRSFLRKQSQIVSQYSVNGCDLNPAEIRLELREVQPNTLEEIIFRWWNLAWWSMPYQRPYGRQMRFILWDTTHNAPFGLIALQSPILKQAVRDRSLGISGERLDYWVNRSMYAQRVGALPPYNYLIGGKLVAMSLVSNEVRNAYQQKYDAVVTRMNGRMIESDLLFITTTSAFGRSSIYNRINYNGDRIAEKLGYTEGYGSFQIPDDLYQEFLKYLSDCGDNIERGYGHGPSRKLKLINLACRRLGVANYSYHGLKREYYCFPFVSNLHDVIAGTEAPHWKDYLFAQLFEFWRTRWMIPRAEHDARWRTFDSGAYIQEIVRSLQEDVENG